MPLNLVRARGVAIALWCLSATWGMADEPPPINSDSSAADQQALAASLVKQLGHPEFATRQRATRRLAAMGVPAKAALLAGLKSGDVEIRSRCRLALLDVLEADYQVRLAAFLADKAGAKDSNLPGWRRFRQLAGDDAASRELFYEMQQSEPGLLESADADPATAVAVLEDRCQSLQNAIYRANDNAQRGLSLGTLAALFFVAGDPQVQIADRHAQSLHNFSYQTPFTETMTGSPKSAALRKIVGAWVVRSTDAASGYLSMKLAMQYELREALEPAVSMVRTQAGPPQVLLIAMLAVGKFGDKQHVPLLERLLDNNAVLLNQPLAGKQMRTEVRDVALAVLVHLTGQELKDYGLSRVQTNPQMLFTSTSIGYYDDEARTAAFKKWKEWAR